MHCLERKPNGECLIGHEARTELGAALEEEVPPYPTYSR